LANFCLVSRLLLTVQSAITRFRNDVISYIPANLNLSTAYIVHRNRLLHIFARIQEHSNVSEQPGYVEAMELDAALRSTYESLPGSLNGYKANELQVESDIAMRKLFLALTYLKGILMLHRPFLLLGREDNRYEYSRAACLDAALEILDYQSLLNVEIQTGLRRWSTNWKLWTTSWRMSTLVYSDFLLATTVLLLDLNKDLESPMPDTNGSLPRERFCNKQPTRAELLASLTSAYEVWHLAVEKSSEAAKVAAAVKLMLLKANSEESRGTYLLRCDIISSETRIKSSSEHSISFLIQTGTLTQL
jgi:hypothetical protein